MNALVSAVFWLHAALQQADRWPGIPVTLDEITSEIRDVPPPNAKREEALVALFKQAGATEGDVQLLPLGAKVEPRLKEMRERTAARLAADGATQPEIDAAIAELDRRHRELGRNVQVVLPGRTERIFGFAAHLDAAEGSAGVIDNWAACVLLANLYQTLRTTRPLHTLWFVGFADEELGCLGSTSWAASLDPKVMQRIDGVVTLDCAGVCSPMAWWSGSHAGFIELAYDVAQGAGVPMQVVDFPGASSDSLALKARSIPVLSLIGIDPPRVRLLHGPEDRFEAIDRDRIAETYTLMRALAADLDVHAQPLLWDYVKAKLRLGEQRKPVRPVKLDLAAVPLPEAPAAEPRAPPSKPENQPPSDGSRP